MTDFPYRERVHACIHPETYKYFLHRDDVERTWKLLEATYGTIRENATFCTIEIETDWCFLRSTRLRNPITVIRKRKFTTERANEFHALLGFSDLASRAG